MCFLKRKQEEKTRTKKRMKEIKERNNEIKMKKQLFVLLIKQE